MIITIDGKACTCEKGEFLLDVARRNRILIPTLCHHEALRGQGSCRLCIVEVVERGRSRIVVSCVFPVEQEIDVLTSSEAVRAQRGLTLALLRKRAPHSARLAALCKTYGAPDLPRLAEVEDTGNCILCGLCVRACKEVGASALATVNRGTTKAVATPYHEPSSVCIGCGSCAKVCPTEAIPLLQTPATRTVWGKTFNLVFCQQCGEPLGTQEEVLFAARKADLAPDGLCPACRQQKLAAVMAHTYGRAE